MKPSMRLSTRYREWPRRQALSRTRQILADRETYVKGTEGKRIGDLTYALGYLIFRTEKAHGRSWE
jgi:hypothetical protein